MFMMKHGETFKGNMVFMQTLEVLNVVMYNAINPLCV